MSQYNSLKATIDANVKQNGVQAITGQILNAVLNAMVNTLGAGYQFAGVATTATNPGSPDAKVFYIANGKGTYTNFGGISVTEDDVVVLYWDSSWHKVSTGIASQAKLSELDGRTNTLRGAVFGVYDNWGKGCCSTASTGQTATLAISTESGRDVNWKYQIVDCKEGDIFVVNASFTTGALFCVNFVDENNLVLKHYYGSLSMDAIVAPPNAKKLVVNNRLSDVPSPFIGGENMETRVNRNATLYPLLENYGYMLTAVGASVSNRVSNPNWACLFVGCSEGQAFELIGRGGGTTKLWAFANKDLKITRLSDASLNVTQPIELTAQENECYFIYNTDISNAPTSYVKAISIINSLSSLSLGLVGVKKEIGSILPDNQKVVSVKSSGGDFSSLTQALAFAENNSPCIVEVYEGTYDVGAEWTDDELKNAGYSGGAWKTGGFVGTRVPNGCTIRGVGDKHKIIIKAETRSVSGATIAWGEISTLNPIGDVTIENVTITGKDMRYAIHDDYDISRPTIHTYKDCIVKYFGLYNGNIKESIGMGLTNGSTVNIERCHLSAMFGVHTNNFTSPAYLNVVDSVIDSGVGIVDYTSSAHSFMLFKNTTIQQVNYSKNGSGEQMCDIRFVGCGIMIPILNANFEYLADNVKRSASSLAIAKCKPVKRVDIRKVAAMTGSDDISVFYGVTLTAIPQTSGDNMTDGSFGNILIEGVVSTEQMGITDAAREGDNVGVVGGAFVLNPTDESRVIGRVFYRRGTNGFIKL